MKTVARINPEIEYQTAKNGLLAIVDKSNDKEHLSEVDAAIDNMKTVINVLIERATPKKRVRPAKKSRRKKTNKPRENIDKLPSEKFPNLDLTEVEQKAENPPVCACCGEQMTESGLYKTSEKLEVVPKQYHIIRSKRVVYDCRSCHGSMVNAPKAPSIAPASNYGDSVIIDVALSKYLDLIPIERYSAMATREGLAGLAPNSLIGLTHYLADFLDVVYLKLKKEVKARKVILADETPHKMLEGDSTRNWFLWGFATSIACVFEAHESRKSDIPLDFLRGSSAKILLTDAYGGYKKALRKFASEGHPILEAYCNAHAYRYFEEAATTWESECEPFLKIYGEIYDLERDAESNKEKRLARKKMVPLFDQLRLECEKNVTQAMPSSAFLKALNYFLNHFEGLTKCLMDINIPIDNNFSERLLRSPVVGRKTWYGTHSKKGARTNAIMFSIVESCKINGINPRHYFTWVVAQIHSKTDPLTPFEFSQILDSG